MHHVQKTVLLPFFCLLSLLFCPVVNAVSVADGIAFWNDSEEQSGIVMDHKVWQGILDKHLDSDHPSNINRFNYRGLSAADRGLLRRYISYLGQMDPRQLKKKEQKAYWINLYNAITVNYVVEDGRNKESIKEIRSGFLTPGPWERNAITIAGQRLTLDDIEHRILRPFWSDNRIHYAVNCASIGCPNLMATAYTGENVELLLEQAAADYINHPRGVKIVNNRLVLSSIYDWYEEDFDDSFAGVVEHLSKYLAPEMAARVQAFRRASYEYDWNFNTP